MHDGVGTALHVSLHSKDARSLKETISDIERRVLHYEQCMVRVRVMAVVKVVVGIRCMVRVRVSPYAHVPIAWVLNCQIINQQIFAHEWLNVTWRPSSARYHAIITVASMPRNVGASIPKLC